MNYYMSVESDLVFNVDIDLNRGKYPKVDIAITNFDAFCITYFCDWFNQIMANELISSSKKDIRISYDGIQAILHGSFPFSLNDSEILISVDRIEYIPIADVREKKFNKIGPNNR